METKAKRLNILAIYLTLVLILSSCSLLKRYIPTQQLLYQGLETMGQQPTLLQHPNSYLTPDIPNPTVFSALSQRTKDCQSFGYTTLKP